MYRQRIERPAVGLQFAAEISVVERPCVETAALKDVVAASRSNEFSWNSTSACLWFWITAPLQMHWHLDWQGPSQGHDGS